MIHKRSTAWERSVNIFLFSLVLPETPNTGGHTLNSENFVFANNIARAFASGSKNYEMVLAFIIKMVTVCFGISCIWAVTFLILL